MTDGDIYTFTIITEGKSAIRTSLHKQWLNKDDDVNEIASDILVGLYPNETVITEIDYHEVVFSNNIKASIAWEKKDYDNV